MSNRRPNILWLMTDEQRCDSLGCYGSPWARTPRLDALADDGAIFQTAVTPAPVCLPARVAMLTGRYPNRNDIWWNNEQHGRTLNHLTALFEQAGYRTASFGKNGYGRGDRAFQTERNAVIADAVHYFHYADQYDAAAHDMVRYPPNPYPWIFGGRFPEPIDHTAEAQVVRWACDWLDHADDDTPFFLRLSFNAPHTPVVVPRPYDTLISRDEIDLPADADAPCVPTPCWLADSLAPIAGSACMSRDDITKMRAYYYNLVASVDHHFGMVIDHLQRRGLMDNTIIAFCSDHGTHLGDHGLVQKQTFYEPVVNVPFWFHAPGRIRQQRVETPVEVLSLMPTLLDLAGLDVPPQCDGVSLAPTLRDGVTPDARPVFSEMTLGSFEIRHDDRLVMVRDGDWKLVLCLDVDGGDGALFDLAADPHERHNLYNAVAHATTQARLTQLIETHVQPAGAARH